MKLKDKRKGVGSKAKKTDTDDVAEAQALFSDQEDGDKPAKKVPELFKLNSESPADKYLD